MTKRLPNVLLLGLLLIAGGCSSVKYKAMEQVGVHKRDILVDRIEKARDAQNSAKTQFLSAYQQFKGLVEVQGGELEEKYDKLSREVERSEARADEIEKRLSAVESVAGDLFEEWERELSLYSNPELRKSSQSKKEFTEKRYQQMIGRMRVAQSRITPVLNVLQDHTLFLKHNLNARAVTSLQAEVRDVQLKVDELVAEMEAAINEAENFVRDMGV